MVVTGYKSEVIRDYLGDGFGGIAVEDVVRPVFESVSRRQPWMSCTTMTLDAEAMVNAFFPSLPGIYGTHCTNSDPFMAVNIYSLPRDTCRRLDQHVTAGQTGCSTRPCSRR